MPKEYDNSNSGTLFRNEKKTEPNHADYNGAGELTCQACGAKSTFWINAWVKTAKESGKKFFSFAFKHKDAPPKQQQPQAAPQPEADIPF